jgi:hypothetical protein
VATDEAVRHEFTLSVAFSTQSKGERAPFPIDWQPLEKSAHPPHRGRRQRVPTFDTANRLWPTNVLTSLCGGFLPVGQRVARSLPERWPAVRSRGKQALAVQGHQLAPSGRGSLVAAPFQPEAGMDAKTRNLALLAALSLFCAGVAWILDYFILGSVFFALGVAALGIAWEQYR